MNNMPNTALDYARRGTPIFPCGKDKRPLTARGFHDASTDPGRVKLWWLKNSSALVGVPTGKVSGFFVLDVDNASHGVDGEQSLRDLERQYGKLPETRTARTPSGGRHLYFKCIEGVGNSTGKLGPGLDIRADGGYVIAPGSPGYEWVSETEPATAPEWLISLLTKPKNGTPVKAAQSPTVAFSNGDGTATDLQLSRAWWPRCRQRQRGSGTTR